MTNVLKTKDFNYHNLKGIINSKHLVVLKGNKNSIVVIMIKSDYVSKLLGIIE